MPKEYGTSDGVPSGAAKQGYHPLAPGDWATLTGAEVPTDTDAALNVLAEVSSSEAELLAWVGL